MLFKALFPSLEIQNVIAWFVLLFQVVIFFTGNSGHHKQNGKGARMGAFFMAGFVTKYDSGAARPLSRTSHGIVLSRAETPSSASSHGQNLLHPKVHHQRWRFHRLSSIRQTGWHHPLHPIQPPRQARNQRNRLTYYEGFHHSLP